MIKDKITLGFLTIILIIISIYPITNHNAYAYQLGINNILPIIEAKKADLLVAEYLDNSIIDEEQLALLEENESQENITELHNEERIEEENQQSAKDDIIDNKSKNNPEMPNRGVPIQDNRTVSSDFSKHLNNYVLDVIKTYDYKNGGYPYLLNNDFENYNGVTEDIYYQGEVILKAHQSGKKYSHCTGISFEVFFKAMQKRNKDYGIDINDFNGMTKEELKDFMLIWYVAMGPKSESNLALAIEKYGLGERITNLEEVAPGDFIDLSRENNTGHAVVFIDWIREGDKIIGIRHWSSQQSTNGISHKEEYFNIKNSNGKKYGNVLMDSLYIARVNPISEYR